MKKFILLFFGVLLFDTIYVFLYDQFLIDIEPYPLCILKNFNIGFGNSSVFS